jgi:hypothetical protein
MERLSRPAPTSRLPLFELARVLVRLDHVASFIGNANQAAAGWSVFGSA